MTFRQRLIGLILNVLILNSIESLSVHVVTMCCQVITQCYRRQRSPISHIFTVICSTLRVLCQRCHRPASVPVLQVAVPVHDMRRRQTIDWSSLSNSPTPARYNNIYNNYSNTRNCLLIEGRPSANTLQTFLLL